MRNAGHSIYRPYLGFMLAAYIFMGMGLMLDGLDDRVNTTLARLGVFDPALIGIGGLVAVGALLALVGLWPLKKLSQSWTLQSVGHILLIGGWGVYAGALITLAPTLVIAWGFPLAACLASTNYLRVVLREEKTTRLTMEEPAP